MIPSGYRFRAIPLNHKPKVPKYKSEYQGENTPADLALR
jgi:hypothetical protein